jgi:hypothetical protein
MAPVLPERGVIFREAKCIKNAEDTCIYNKKPKQNKVNGKNSWWWFKLTPKYGGFRGDNGDW